MIRFVRGDLLLSPADALVNAVNCVGAMGKGIAYQFRLAYPAMFEDYRRRCAAGQIRPGEVTCFRERGKLIVNVPTKRHWRDRALPEDLIAGLRALRAFMEREALASIALPALGCGNGGLGWPYVRGRIEAELSDLPGVDIEVYEPEAGPKANR